MASRRALSAALVLVCSALAATGCGSSAAKEGSGEEVARTTTVAGAARAPVVIPPRGAPPEQLVVERLRPGWGAQAREGDLLRTKFVAVRFDGKPFESTWDPGGRPFAFHLGADEASPAWEKGLRGMSVGERRELLVPADVASRFGPLPPGNDLVYVVELIGIAPPELDGRHEPTVVVPPGRPPENLRVRDVIAGTGPRVEAGDLVTMRYVSRHYTGKPFSNSWDDGHPFRIHLGADTFKSIPGWEEALPGMRVGGRREVIVPPDLIFRGPPPPSSQPSETLVYLIDMFGVTEPGAFRQAPKGG